MRGWREASAPGGRNVRGGATRVNAAAVATRGATAWRGAVPIYYGGATPHPAPLRRSSRSSATPLLVRPQPLRPAAPMPTSPAAPPAPAADTGRDPHAAFYQRADALYRCAVEC